MSSAALPPPIRLGTVRLPDAEVAIARATTRRAGRTFALASRLLGAEVRDDVYLLYHVLRTLDDLVDHRRPGAEDRVAAVADWARGRPGERTEEVLLLRALDARHPLPADAVLAFCEGMGADLRRERFATEADVDRYCFQVAGTVGLLLTAILGSSDPDQAAPAASALGMAMQRTNILRDIDEDAAAGRCFLAQDTMDRFGAPAPGARAELLRDGIARADALYAIGDAGIPLLRQGRRAVAAASAMYREILRQIEREGLGVRPGRAVVSTRRKLRVGARAVRRA